MQTFRFRDFETYKESKALYQELVGVTASFPKRFFHLAEQIRRSSLSVPLNIAEGSAKRSDKDFYRYVQIALGSINETVAAIDIALSLRLIEPTQADAITQKSELITKRLGSLSKKLIAKSWLPIATS